MPEDLAIIRELIVSQLDIILIIVSKCTTPRLDVHSYANFKTLTDTHSTTVYTGETLIDTYLFATHTEAAFASFVATLRLNTTLHASPVADAKACRPNT
jgi:hypothetical protein